MRGAHTWHGRRGTVILGPTEHRVATYLRDLTRAGRITLRMTDLIAATHVERSEGYRITDRLRVLGLFGIENDRGGTKGGRRIWRTAIEHDASVLDAQRHREAWARVVAWSRARAARLASQLAAIRGHHTRQSAPLRSFARPSGLPTAGPIPPESGRPATLGSPPAPESVAGGGTFLDRLIAAGLSGRLTADFGRGVQ